MSSHVVSWVLKHSDEQLGARLVLLALAEHAGGDGADAFPSVETIMRETRLSRRTVQTALRDLETRGAISRNGQGPRGTTNYTVNVGGADSAPGADNDAGGRNLRHEGGAADAPEPTTEPKTEPPTGEQTALLPSPTMELWSYWNERRGRDEKLTSKHSTVLKNALKVRTLNQCMRAIDGLFANPWWRDNGKLELRFALAGRDGQSDGERIDRQIADATRFAGGAGTLRDDYMRRLSTAERDSLSLLLQRAAQVHSANESERNIATSAAARLLSMGIEIVWRDGKAVDWTYQRPEAA